MEAKIISFLISLLYLIASLIYSWKVIKKEKDPKISTWGIFLFATSISSLSYLLSKKSDFVTGTIIIIDFFSCIIIFSSVCFFSQKKSGLDPFERKYLGIALAIGALWVFIGSFSTNLLVQALITVGYLPTIQNLIRSEKNPETTITWVLIFIASLISIILAIGGGYDVLSIVYSIRSSVMTGIILAIILAKF